MRWRDIRFTCRGWRSETGDGTPKRVSPQSPYTTMTNDQLARATVSLDILVRFVETDAMGVVHHSNYLVWFEAARVAWMDAADMPYAEVAAGGHHFAVTAVEVEYRAPVRFGETVRVTVAVRQLRSQPIFQRTDFLCRHLKRPARLQRRLAGCGAHPVQPCLHAWVGWALFPVHGSKMVEPVVLRASRSRWAWRTSASG